MYIVEGSSDWYKIITENGQEGCVSAQYIKEADSNQEEQNSGSSLLLDPIVGTWNLSYIYYPDYPDETKYYDDSADYSYTFYSDGTGCFSNSGIKENFNYKKFNDNEYGWELPIFVIRKGELVWTLGIMEYHFVKK